MELAMQDKKRRIRIYAASLLVLLAASVLLHEACFGRGDSQTSHMSAQEGAVGTGHATMTLCAVAVVLALALLWPTKSRSVGPPTSRVEATPVAPFTFFKPRVRLSFRELCVMRA